MRLLGYCTSCRRFRYVRVSGHELAMLAVKKVAEGICAQCEEREDKERRERHGLRR